MIERSPSPIWLCALIALVGTPVGAQEWRQATTDEWCDDERGSRRNRACEVRTLELPATGETLVVDGGPNGGVRVTGWNDSRILVTAKVQAWSERGGAPDLDAVEIVVDGAHLKARSDRNEWAVSYRIQVPRNYDLDLVANNGGLAVEGVEGTIQLETRNGGIHLAAVGGNVRGETRNGGLHVELDGDRWHGEGLDVSTRNGGIDLSVPEGYSADLLTGTVNGPLHFDFPVMMQGDLKREVRTTLGDGGPPIRVRTTNGGVKVSRTR